MGFTMQKQVIDQHDTPHAKALKRLSSTAIRYCPESGAFHYRTGKRADTLLESGYRVLYTSRGMIKAHRAAWLLGHGEVPDGPIDHINGDPSDNRLDNLRVVTQSENMRNASLYSNNKSGLPGVRWRDDKGKWVASIKIDGRHRGLGSFPDFFSACCARKSAELEHGFHPNHGRMK